MSLQILQSFLLELVQYNYISYDSLKVYFLDKNRVIISKQDQMSIDAIEGKTLRTQMTDNLIMIHKLIYLVSADI